MSLYSIYLHIPFCTHRCGYCDFNTYAGLEDLIPAYVEALCREARIIRENLSHPLDVHTIFFGGGTPSLLSVSSIEKILDTLVQRFSLCTKPEITLEANPGTVSEAYLRDLFTIGVNRLSLGMQSAQPTELHFLERQHNFPDVIHAVHWARKAGFDNLNLDLIFGLPGQNLNTWKNNLTQALRLSPEHLSLYALTIEHGTPMGRWLSRGLIDEPDPDVAASMYETASDILNNIGYTQYEISNWARHTPGAVLSPCESPSRACVHNLQYWRNLPYIGLGAGAHGYIANVRTANVLSPRRYIQHLSNAKESHSTGEQKDFPATPVTQDFNAINLTDEIGETMMMGLRLTREGISSQAFENRFQRPLQDIFPKQIKRLIQTGLIEWVDDSQLNLRLTPQGRLLGNRVFQEFI